MSDYFAAKLCKLKSFKSAATGRKGGNEENGGGGDEENGGGGDEEDGRKGDEEDGGGGREEACDENNKTQEGSVGNKRNGKKDRKDLRDGGGVSFVIAPHDSADTLEVVDGGGKEKKSKKRKKEKIKEKRGVEESCGHENVRKRKKREAKKKEEMEVEKVVKKSCS